MDMNRRPLVIAHRGASGLAPENTLAAFGLAINLGANGVEMDVQLSADGQPVVIHDTRLNRTTNARGPVTSLTVSQLGQVDAGGWFERRLAVRPRVRAMVEAVLARENGNGLSFSGESVPTLEATLALLVPARLARVYIELKSGPASREALLESVLALVRQFGMQQVVTLLSFDHEAVRLAKRAAPEIRTAATFPISGRSLVTASSIVRSAESVAANEAALHFGLASRRAVETLRARGLEVSAWTANSPLVMRRLITHGVDSIMTNFPNRLIGLMDSTEQAHVGRVGRKRRRQR